MKRIYRLLLTTLAVSLGIFVSAQSGALNPADPEIVFTSTSQPAAPAWGQISKWGHTKRLSWNSFTAGYKCYYFKGMAFRLKFPKSYQHNVADGKTYPLFIFLHGLGEKGTIWDNEWSLLHGGQEHAAQVNNGTFDGFLLYPQNQGGYFPAYNGAISDLIDSLVKYVKVNEDRVLLSGLSAGAQGDWDYAADYSKDIAGLLPISAAQTEDTVYFNRYITVPVFTANGGQDINPTPQMATAVFNAFLRLGGSLRQIYYPTQGHSVWTSFWQEPGYYSNLNTYHKANPLVYFGRTEFCPGETFNVKLGVQAGFSAYEWQKNSVTIPGATSESYIATDYGTYRVRFKRTSTSNWSEWSPSPVTISIKQPTVTPPVTINGIHSKVLPAPDGSTTVPLMVPSNYVSYEWRRVSDNVLVGNGNIYNAPVGDYKVKVAEQFGCSSSFSPAFSVINANGTNVPDKASNVTALSQSNTSVQLDWSDNPTPANNETGFEIYRGTAAGGPYTLVAINPADNLSYLDVNLAPNKKYFYIVRAVNNNGAAPSSSEVGVITKSDTQMPSAPSNLTITATTRSSISLSWDASTDDVGISKYFVYVNGTKAYTTTGTQFTVNNLDKWASYNFYVKALDVSSNLSPQSNQVTGIAQLSGLSYKYYEGSWDALPNFSLLTPVKVGITANVSLAPRNQSDLFAFLWEGYINIPVAGTYTFGTTSDDGSRLYIGQYSASATPVVNNDGLHGSTTVTGNYTFPSAGLYPIAITFFEKTGGEAMSVTWRSTAAGITSTVAIPDNAFKDNISPSGNPPTTPSYLRATATSYNRIALNWLDNSSDETGFEIYRSTTYCSGYASIATVAPNTLSYVDTTCAASTRYFYRVRAIGANGESNFSETYVAAQWAFNNNYNDASGNGRALSQSNNPTFDATSQAEGTHSVKLNGTNQSITISNSGSFLQTAFSEGTIFLWMRSQNNTGNRIVFDIGGSDNGLALQLNNNTIQAGIASGSTRRTTTAVNYTSTAWNHVALVYSGSVLTLYVNGTAVATNSTALGFTSVGATSNGSRIGANNGSNAFNIAGGFFSGWIDNFTIVSKALSANEIAALANNSFVPSNATTNALPVVPAAPSSLAATTQSSSKISLTWNDNSSDETGFDIYRSTNNNTTYRLLSSVPANGGSQVSYSDSGLYSNVTYYYKVLAKGVGGSSGYSNEANAKTLNNAPAFSGLNNVVMRHSTQKTVSVLASDPEGSNVTLSIVGSLPAFATFTPTGSGAGNLSFNPSSAQQGIYTIQLSANDGNGGIANGSFTLTVNNNYPPSVNGITNVTLTEGANQAINLTATDQDGVSGLQWSASSLPAFATISTNPDGSGKIQLAPGYAHSGVYNLTATVTDPAGGTDSKSFTVTVTENNPVTNTVYMSVRNYPYSAPAPAPWNSISGQTTNNLKNQSGQTTSIGLAFQTTAWSTESMGAVTGNNSGVYPDEIIKDHYWFGIWGRPDVVDVKLTGLNAMFKYNITLFASSTYNNFANNGSTTYTINGVSKSLAVQNNQQNTVIFSNIVPDASGNITITMTKDPNAGGWLNAIVASEVFDDGTSPVQPTNLTASALTDGTIKLKWTDIAYNESRYEVYRSTSLNGVYNLINPGMDNPNDSIYVDNSLVSGTTYYYKLLAVNGYGNQGYTNAVNATALNKAPVLNPITNIFVKAGNNATTNFTAVDDAGEALTVSVKNLPSFAIYQNTGNGKGQISFAPTASNVGIYPITVDVADPFGGTSSVTFSVFVSDRNTRSVYVNIGPETQTPAAKPWNNLLSYPFPNLLLNNLKDENDVTTNYSFSVIDQFTGRFSGGMNTGKNSGVYPDEVIKGAFFESTTGVRRIRFSGLDAAKKYNVVILSSMNGSQNTTATATSGGKTITLNGKYNSDKGEQLNGLIPDASGQITVTLTKSASAAYLLLNAVVLEEYNPSITVLNPINLLAAPDSTTRVKLTWSDRADNETGYEVWRSINGAGYSLVTTLAANATTYTDANRAPNNKYFYQVRAKNGAASSDYSNVASVVLSKKIVYVDFDAVQRPVPYPWNNTATQLVEGAEVGNFIDNLGNNTGYGLSMITHFNDEHDEGLTTGNNSGVYPDAVIMSTFWMDVNQVTSYKLENLDQSKVYRLWFFGSFKWGYAADFTTTYTVNGKTVYLNCYENNSKAVYIDGIKPNEDGEIYVDVSAPPTSVYGFQSALVFESYDPNLNDISVTPLRQMRVTDSNTDVLTEAPDNNAESTVRKLEGNIYPNPFSTKLNLSFKLSEKSDLSIMVTDVSGKTILKKDITGLSAGVHSETLNLGSSIPSGAYLITVVHNGKVERTWKAVKN